MKAYVIFAIVLTILYVLYYAATIVKDLYGSKGQKKSDEEEFDVGGLGDGQSVSVVETDNGFKIGEKEQRTDGTVEPESREGEAKPRKNPVETLNDKVRENMEETQVTFSDPYNSAELYKMMLQGGKGGPPKKGDVKVKPAIDEL